MRRVVRMLPMVLALFLLAASPARATLDVVFAIDTSPSITADDYNAELAGIVNAVTDPTRVPRDGSVRVAIVQFPATSADAVVALPFQTVTSANHATIISQIGAIPQPSTNGTNPGDGIVAATGLFTGSTATEKAICLTTDGAENITTVTTAAAATSAAAAGIHRLTIIASEQTEVFGFFTAAEATALYGPLAFPAGEFSVVSDESDWANQAGLACLAPASGPSSVIDFRLKALEVTQVVQDWANTVPLIARDGTDFKTTIVRAHLEHSQAAPVPVAPRLILVKPTPTAGISPNNAPFSVPVGSAAANARRETLSQTAFWQLPNSTVPDDWTAAGPKTFRIVLDGVGIQLVECPPGAVLNMGGCDVTLPSGFVAGVARQIRFFPVTLNNVTTTPAQIAALKLQMTALFPAARLVYSDGNAQTCPGAVSVDQCVAQVSVNLASAHALLSQTDQNNIRFYAALPIQSVAVGGTSGQASSIPGRAAAGAFPISNPNDLSSLPSTSAFGRLTLVHELLHLYGAHHSVPANATVVSTPLGNAQQGACGELAATTASAHPHFGDGDADGDQEALIGPLTGDYDIRYGLDATGAPAVRSPRRHFELMSYCRPSTQPDHRWISKERFGDPANPQAGTLAGGPSGVSGTNIGIADMLVVSGFIDPATGMAQFQPLFTFPSGFLPDPTPGNYSLEVRDASGAVLHQIMFGPDTQVIEGASTGLLPFSVFVPLSSAGAMPASVHVIASGGATSALSASAAGPSVTVNSPATGDSFAASINVQWTAADSDTPASQLVSSLQFSADDGATFSPIASGLAGSSFSVGRPALTATTDGRFRVIVSDGFNSASALSGRFTVENAPPQVQANLPVVGDLFIGAEAVNFTAAVSDPDETIPDAQVSWSSDRDGAIGTGRSFSLQASALSVNANPYEIVTHIVTVTATDGQGEMASAFVPVRVQRVAPPTVPVVVDVKPGSSSNGINLGSIGVTPVAILGPTGFSFSDLDVTTLAFGPGGSHEKHDLTDPAVFASHLQDVNLDGQTDLMLHFLTQDLGLGLDQSIACLTGLSLDNPPFAIEGCDTVAPRFPQAKGCGLGFELAFALLPIFGARAWRRRMRSRGSPESDTAA